MDVLEHALDTSKSNDIDDEECIKIERMKEELSSSGVTIVEEDDGVENGVAVSPGTTLVDPGTGVHYQIGTSDGPMTYRVVHVTDGATAVEGPQIVSSTSLASGSIQAVLASSFNGGGSDGEPRITYVPTVAGEAGDGAMVATTTGGQVYVIGSQDLGQRTLAPRSGNQVVETRSAPPRDDRRRATHNEVERRRRDKINNWIVKLARIIPDCQQDHTKQGQVPSKGGILAKACVYIQELKNTNHRLTERIREYEKTNIEVNLLRTQNEKLKAEVAILRSQSSMMPGSSLNS